MRRTAVFTLGVVLAAIPLLGADTPQMRGALVTDLTLNPNDSLLVRAAKITVATRASMTIHSTRVIDNDSLRAIAGAGHFTISTTEVPANPVVLGPSNPAPVSPYQQQNTQTVTPVVQPSTMPRPFSLPPPPPPTNPTPYRPPQ